MARVHYPRGSRQTPCRWEPFTFSAAAANGKEKCVFSSHTPQHMVVKCGVCGQEPMLQTTPVQVQILADPPPPPPPHSNYSPKKHRRPFEIAQISDFTQK